MNQEKKISLTRDELDSFVSILTRRTGIVPRSSHLDGIKAYIEKQIETKNLGVQGYKNALAVDVDLFNELVNESTVNETYFFREEKQFALLRNRIFPMWRALNSFSEIKIWSAACSFGEEAYSLLLLARSCCIPALITASDINSDVLEHCKKGVYPASSMRMVDGTAFKELLKPHIRKDGMIEFDEAMRNCVRTQKINLSTIDSPLNDSLLPKNQNIIFLRNVFIYFSKELRARILRTIAEKCLAEGGVLFVSMSEIAQLDSEVIPNSLEKIAEGNVFYFHKKTGGKSNG